MRPEQSVRCWFFFFFRYGRKVLFVLVQNCIFIHNCSWHDLHALFYLAQLSIAYFICGSKSLPIVHKQLIFHWLKPFLGLTQMFEQLENYVTLMALSFKLQIGSKLIGKIYFSGIQSSICWMMNHIAMH